MNTIVKLQGLVHKVTVKPPKLNDDGNVIGQDIDIVLHVELDDYARTALGDLTRLQNGQTTNFIMEATMPELPFKDEEKKVAARKPA